MYSLEDVLRKKESQAEKLRGEIEALRMAAHILEQTEDRPMPVVVSSTRQQEQAKSWP